MAAVIKFLVVGLGVFASMVAGAALVLTQAPELLPKALAADTATQVEAVKTDSASVFTEIQKNIDLVTELRAKVSNAQLNGEAISLNDVIRDIETVTKSYESLAGQRDEIRKELLAKVAKVETMRMAIDAEISILRLKRADYSEQLRLVADPNPEITTTRKEALARAIAYLDQQMQLWARFGDVEKDITLEMTDIQRTIDSFLSMIESTSIVFREGLNLLYLQQDINEAIALFSSDIPRMTELASSMEASWDNLDYLLNTLTGVAKLGGAK
jgi:hypothetical protein